MRILFAIITISIPTIVLAHGGRLDSRGCHNDRQSGGYHCHNSAAAPVAPRPFVATPQEAIAPTPANVESLYDTRVETVQRLLNSLGYDAGEEFGILNTRTIAAIRTFEGAENIQPTGAVTNALILSLVKKLDEIRQENTDTLPPSPK